MNRSSLAAAAIGAAFLLALSVVAVPVTEELTKEQILSSGPEWQAEYDKYLPTPDMVSALRSKLGTDMRVDVYLGLWCPDSRNNVPHFIKILDCVGTAVQVRYFGVPRKASKDVKYYVEEMKVDRVPTFIFYRNGEEIGRIVENPKAGLLEDMMEIVFR
jgi:hypothetical protein